MKRLLLTVILLFIFIPKLYAASGDTSYDYINATINNDGSLTIKEYYLLAGTYNGSIRELNYTGATNHFTGKKEDLEGSDIYNGTSIINISVYDTIVKDNNIVKNKKFTNDQYAQDNDYGVYKLTPDNNGIEVKIYNPSFYETGFYLEYTITDAVIIHNDVAEIGWNFFGKDYNENTNNLIINFYLPNTNRTLKGWVHGPLDGQIELINNYQAEVTYHYLPSNTPIDVRLVFDKDIVPNATKKSNIKALDYILQIEQERADKASAIRQHAKLIISSINLFTYLWYLILIVILINVYRKYDKEYKPSFTHKYYREFTGNYGPEVVDYLFKHDLTSLGLSSSILELIRKKHLTIEMINKKDYKLMKNDSQEQLTEAEQYLKDWFINDIGNGESVSVKDITYASSNRTRSLTFIEKLEAWKKIVNKETEKQTFSEDNMNIKNNLYIYLILSTVTLSILHIIYLTNNFLGYLMFIPTIIAIIYITQFNKRTKKGNEHYHKWLAFKRFLLDFGRFKDKELPEIYLWEKYLVYATVLGIATKVAKVMQIKLEKMNLSPAIMPHYTFLYYNNVMMAHYLTHSINTSINRTITTAVANSRMSSGSGFGGGASFGGGGFGGGGGGGRF